MGLFYLAQVSLLEPRLGGCHSPPPLIEKRRRLLSHSYHDSPEKWRDEKRREERRRPFGVAISPTGPCDTTDPPLWELRAVGLFICRQQKHPKGLFTELLYNLVIWLKILQCDPTAGSKERFSLIKQTGLLDLIAQAGSLFWFTFARCEWTDCNVLFCFFFFFSPSIFLSLSL